MVIGMITVFLFLCIQIVLITVVARLTKGIAQREVEEIEKARLERAQRAKKSKEKGPPMAVLAAAVATYEANK